MLVIRFEALTKKPNRIFSKISEDGKSNRLTKKKNTNARSSSASPPPNETSLPSVRFSVGAGGCAVRLASFDVAHRCAASNDNQKIPYINLYTEYPMGATDHQWAHA